MKRKLLFFLCLIYALRSDAQDINFSQFYETPLLRNPALSGLFVGDIRMSGAYRTQWASVTVPYQTEALSAELRFAVSEIDYLSLGLQIVNDVAGDSKLGRTELLPALTFHKSINGDKDTYLSAGFIGGAVQQRFDPSKLRFDDQFVNGSYSPTNPTRQTFDRTSRTYYDISVGLLYSSVLGEDIKYYIGASYFHFAQPKVAFSTHNDIRLNKKIMINAGLSAPTSEFDKIILYTDIYTQGGSTGAQGGLMYKHDLMRDEADETLSISGGAFMRWNDAVMPVVKLDYYKLSFGFTYDVNISKLRAASSAHGAFELTIAYRNFLNSRNSSVNKVRCPVGF